MSGGHFDYVQFRINEIVDGIERLDGWSPGTKEKFEEALLTLRRAEIMATRIDWLVSGDDSEETFHKRWDKDLEELDV